MACETANSTAVKPQKDVQLEASAQDEYCTSLSSPQYHSRLECACFTLLAFSVHCNFNLTRHVRCNNIRLVALSLKTLYLTS